MKNYVQIVTKITTTPWLITEEALRNILDILDRHLHDDEEFNLALFDLDGEPEPISQVVDGVGILSLGGPIFPKANLLTKISGATSLEMFRNEFRNLIADDSVHSILLNVDSPGGVSDLVNETGEEIFAAREIKPVVAIANTMAASAAYWLATQASEFYITPSGLTGSLGVYTVHTDDSEQLKKEGIVKTVIQAGKAKAGHEQPLNEHSRQNLQEVVDDLYGDFVEAVARSRNTTIEHVEENYGQGGIVTPKKALEVGMVDGIETVESLMSRMTQNGGVVGKASATAAINALVDHGYTVSVTPSSVSVAPGSALLRSASLEQEKSHGDPGPNGEPIPREPAEKGDKAIEGGWRVPTPPGSSFPIKNASLGQNGGSVVVTREQLEALATRLSIAFSEETSDDELIAAINEGVEDIVVPLVEAEAQATVAQDFERLYPQQAAELRRLRERDEESEARLFAERWERFEISEDGTTRRTTQGFTARTLQHIESIHLKLARRQLSSDDIAALLDSIAAAGVVDYSEKGSARSGHNLSGPANLQGMTIRQIRQTYADEVRRVMEEDGVTRKVAQGIVNERDPELAEMYRTGHLRIR